MPGPATVSVIAGLFRVSSPSLFSKSLSPRTLSPVSLHRASAGGRAGGSGETARVGGDARLSCDACVRAADVCLGVWARSCGRTPTGAPASRSRWCVVATARPASALAQRQRRGEFAVAGLARWRVAAVLPPVVTRALVPSALHFTPPCRPYVSGKPLVRPLSLSCREPRRDIGMRDSSMRDIGMRDMREISHAVNHVPQMHVVLEPRFLYSCRLGGGRGGGRGGARLVCQRARDSGRDGAPGVYWRVLSFGRLVRPESPHRPRDARPGLAEARASLEPSHRRRGRKIGGALNIGGAGGGVGGGLCSSRASRGRTDRRRRPSTRPRTEPAAQSGLLARAPWSQ